MAFSFEWNAAYEAYPVAGSVRQIIDDEIRRYAAAIRERMEPEHNWGPFTEKDDGSHRAGEVTVCLLGADPAGVSGPRDGALYVKQDGSDLQLYVRASGAWVKASSLDHGGLTNLGVNVHTQYLLKTGGNMTGNIEMGGNHVRVPAATGHTAAGLLLYRHAKEQHSAWGDISAIKDGSIPATAIKYDDLEYSGTLTASAYAYINCGHGLYLCPMFYGETHSVELNINLATNWGWTVTNQNIILSKDYRFNIRRVSS